MKRAKILSLLFIFLIAATNLCFSQKIDIEADPIAYIFNGFSVHGGLNTDHVRYDLGLFGIEVPGSFHGNDGFNQYILGGGLKADYFLTGTQSGFYMGAGTDLTSSRLRLDETGNEKTVIQFGAGINVGYKFSLTPNLFIKPWFGLSYLFKSDTVEIDGQMFEQSAIRPFPTVHIGWTF
jgi:hypothetical protein